MKSHDQAPIPEAHDRRFLNWEWRLRLGPRGEKKSIAVLQLWTVVPIGSIRARWLWRSPLWEKVLAKARDRCACCGGRFGLLEARVRVPESPRFPRSESAQYDYVVAGGGPGCYHADCYRAVREERLASRRLEGMPPTQQH